jgi:acetyl esterase
MTDQAPTLEATVQAFLDTVATIGTPPLHELDFEPARESLRSLQCPPVSAPPASIEDRVFPVGPTGSVGVRIVRPHGSNGGDPVILYLHGGGWMMGGKDTHDRLLRELATGAGATIIFVEYTLAPEARYPVQNEQAYAVLHYIVQNATELNLRIVLLSPATVRAATLRPRSRCSPSSVEAPRLFFSSCSTQS